MKRHDRFLGVIDAILSPPPAPPVTRRLLGGEPVIPTGRSQMYVRLADTTLIGVDTSAYANGGLA